MKLEPNSEKTSSYPSRRSTEKLIESDEYKNGKLLPNEVLLSEQLNISRNTLRQAINKLVFEGLLVRKKGHGTKVVRKGITGGVKNWLSFSQEMKMLGIEIKTSNCISASKTIGRNPFLLQHKSGRGKKVLGIRKSTRQ